MKTIQKYNKLKTKDLQKLLKKYETQLYEFDSLKNISESLENEMMDLEIDISLIRTELNKRLWYGEN